MAAAEGVTLRLRLIFNPSDSCFELPLGVSSPASGPSGGKGEGRSLWSLGSALSQRREDCG